MTDNQAGLTAEDLLIEFGRTFLLRGKPEWATVVPAGIPIPTSYTTLTNKAGVLSQTMNRSVTDLFEAVWYPRYDAECRAMAAWVDERIDQTVLQVEEVRGLTGIPDATFGGTSTKSMGQVYAGWLEWVVRKMVEQAVTEGWSETDLSVRLDSAYQSMRSQVMDEVVQRLAVFTSNVVVYYKGFIRPYFLVSVPALPFIFGALKVLKAIAMKLEFGGERVVGMLSGPAGEAVQRWHSVVGDAWARFKFKADPTVRIAQFFQWVRDAIEKLKGSGQSVGFMAPLLTVPSAVVAGIVGFLCAVLFISLEVDAPEVPPEEWWAQFDSLPDADVIRQETARVVAEGEEIIREIEAIEKVLADPFYVKPAFSDVQVAPTLIAGEDLWPRMKELLRRSEQLDVSAGQEALVPVKLALRRRLGAIMGEELRGAATLPPVTEEELDTFIDPLRFLEIIGPRVAELTEGREISDEEAPAILTQAAEDSRAELEIYARELVGRILSARESITTTAWEDSGLISAVDAMDTVDVLTAGKSLDRAMYEHAKGQLEAASGKVPPEVETMVAKYLSFVNQVLQVMDDSGYVAATP